MNTKISDREIKIYDKIMELENGDEKDKYLAFECTGILGNESINNSLENKLNIVEDLINKHLENKKN